jgi:hypothetical protein
MHIYGKMRKGGTMSKLADKIMQITHAKLMAHNLKVILKNAIDSFWNFTKEVAGGKYFTAVDALAAQAHIWSEICTLKHIRKDLGRANSGSLTAAILDRNGVSGTSAEIFKGQRSFWFKRVISKFSNMGEYSFVDYVWKGNIALSVYNNHRLMVNPVTGEK